MNTNDERKQLELATSNAPEQNLDAETAELREGWRVLAKTLQQSGGPFDEGALVCQIAARNGCFSTAGSKQNGQRRGWMVVAALLGEARSPLRCY